jgi:acylphosphatase
MAVPEARLYWVRGRVQGVGFRNFVQREADQLALTGWSRNLDDGRVEVMAQGPAEKLKELEGLLWKGPRWAEVRGVESTAAAPVKTRGFQIK